LSEDIVKLTEVGTEIEASMICGALEANGIHAVYDGGNSQALGGGAPFFGRQEILVRAEDLERAREILEEAQGE
jgi:hypothetical protein